MFFFWHGCIGVWAGCKWNKSDTTQIPGRPPAKSLKQNEKKKPCKSGENKPTTNESLSLWHALRHCKKKKHKVWNGMDILSGSAYNKFRFRDKIRAKASRTHYKHADLRRRICKLISVVCRELCATKRCLIAEWYTCNVEYHFTATYFLSPPLFMEPSQTSLQQPTTIICYALHGVVWLWVCRDFFQWIWKSCELLHNFLFQSKRAVYSLFVTSLSFCVRVRSHFNIRES